MEHVTFTPKGVCSIQIDFDLEDGKLYNVQFIGGCNGNLKAIGKLVEGKERAHPALTSSPGQSTGRPADKGFYIMFSRSRCNKPGLKTVL